MADPTAKGLCQLCAAEPQPWALSQNPFRIHPWNFQTALRLARFYPKPPDLISEEELLR